LTIVMAAEGYPGTPKKGAPIRGIREAEAQAAIVFQAGTTTKGADLVANGGRVLNVTAAGGSVAEARDIAYRAIEAIDFPEGFFRKDIGWRELSRMRND